MEHSAVRVAGRNARPAPTVCVSKDSDSGETMIPIRELWVLTQTFAVVAVCALCAEPSASASEGRAVAQAVDESESA